MSETRALGASEVADMLGVHVETIRRMARNGEIPAFKVGKDWRFNTTEMLELRESGRAEGAAPRVLVIDDDWQVRDLVDCTLRRSGFEVSSCANGEEGLRLMERIAPDVVILDLVMPGMDGVEVLQRIRQRAQWMPVIIMTGFSDSERMQTALEYSPVTVLAKPVMSETLIAAVREKAGVAVSK